MNRQIDMVKGLDAAEMQGQVCHLQIGDGILRTPVIKNAWLAA
jgi:hypothetical protein